MILNQNVRNKMQRVGTRSLSFLLLAKPPRSRNIWDVELQHLRIRPLLLETNRLSIIITGWTEFRGGGVLCAWKGGESGDFKCTEVAVGEGLRPLAEFLCPVAFRGHHDYYCCCCC